LDQFDSFFFLLALKGILLLFDISTVKSVKCLLAELFERITSQLFLLDFAPDNHRKNKLSETSSSEPSLDKFDGF